MRNWKTTATAIALILTWALPKAIPGLEIPTDVQVAMSTIIYAIGLALAKDHDK